jgi:hypothetical protein
MKAEGIGGELLVGGYQHAAYLGPWRLGPSDSGPDHWKIVAQLVHVDSYWITQSPVRVVLRLGDLEWSWDDVQFDPDNPSASIVSGMPREGVRVVRGG